MNIFNPDKYPIEICMLNLFVATAVADFMARSVVGFVLMVLI